MMIKNVNTCAAADDATSTAAAPTLCPYGHGELKAIMIRIIIIK